MAGVADALQDSREVMADVVVADAEDAKAARRQHAVTLGVVVCLSPMDCAVDLYHQAGLGAEEVGDEAVDDLLPMESEAVEPVISQAVPQRRLLRRHLAAELPGPTQLLRVHAMPRDDPLLLPHRDGPLPTLPVPERGCRRRARCKYRTRRLQRIGHVRRS